MLRRPALAKLGRGTRGWGGAASAEMTRVGVGGGFGREDGGGARGALVEMTGWGGIRATTVATATAATEILRCAQNDELQLSGWATGKGKGKSKGKCGGLSTQR